MTDIEVPGVRDVDPKLAKLVNNYRYGAPTEFVPCVWKGRAAVVALLANGVAFGSIGFTSRSTAGSVGQVSFKKSKRGNRWELGIAGESFEVEFPSAALANAVAAGIEQVRRRPPAAAAVGNEFGLTGDEQSLNGCTYIGGANMSLEEGLRVDLVFRRDSLDVFTSFGAVGRPPRVTLSYGDSFQLEVGGPGKVTTGGGFSGGGFGLVSATEGIAMAAALNLLST